MRAIHALLACIVATPGARAETLFIETGTLLPIEGDAIPGGRIVVKDGQITEVGKDLQRPSFSRLIDARSYTVTPGFVVAATRFSLPPGDAPDSKPDALRIGMTPAVLGNAELVPLSPELDFALRQGITTLGLLPPGNDEGIPGQVSAVGTRPASTKDMTLQEDAAVLVRVATHAAWRKTVAEAFDGAEDAIEKEDDKSKNGGKSAAKKDDENDEKKKDDKKKDDRASDPLQRLLRKQEACFVACGSPAGWVAAQDTLPLADMNVTLLDAFDLWPLASDVKKAKMRVLTWPALVRLSRTRYPVNRAAAWEKAGVPYAFMLPNESIWGVARLRDAAIEMLRTGCTRKGVLGALTLEGAKALGLEAKLGSIQKGRRADLLFWTGDPLDPKSGLAFVLIAGERIEPLPQATLADAAP